MQPELELMTISRTEIAIFLMTLLAIFLMTLLSVLLILVRKELSGDAPVRGVFQFGFAIIGLYAVVVFMAAAYFQARKMVLPDPNAQRLDIGTVSQPGRATT